MAPVAALAYDPRMNATPHRLNQRRPDYRPQRAAVLLCLSLVLPGGAAAAGMYRWVDGAGVVHYAQAAPQGHAAQRIDPQLPPPTSAPGISGIDSFTRHYAADRAGADKARQAALRSKAERAEQCAKARQQISALQTATAHRLFVTGADGQRSRMTEDQFKQHLQQAQSRADASCGH